MLPECYPCAVTLQGDDAPPRERVHVEAGWRVALAFNSTLPGWLRHVNGVGVGVGGIGVGLGVIVAVGGGEVTVAVGGTS